MCISEFKKSLCLCKNTKTVMKKTIFGTLAIVLVILSACQQKSGYNVKVTLEGIPDGKVYMSVRGAEGMEKIDSADLFNGHFEMVGEVTEPGMVYLTVPEAGRERPQFFLENSEIVIEGKKGNLSEMSVVGSNLQDQYSAFMLITAPFDEKEAKIYDDYSIANESGDTAAITKIMADYDLLTEARDAAVDTYIAENNNSIISAYIVARQKIYSLELADLEAYQTTFGEIANNSKYGKIISDRIDVLKRVAIGQKAPEIAMPDTAGVIQKLSDLHGKYVLVDFWASWCGPCRVENPNVVKAYQQFHEKGFDIYAISLDQKRDNWLKAIKDDNLTWTQVSILEGWKAPAVKEYGVMSIPANVLVDPNGVIVGRNLRGEDLDAKLHELLK